ncbi:hypothetical protein Sp245p_18390 (plasmid) [Azospirillum baldaniorum]|uniref:Uncharacterized protein n=1 Tax=Azospirillum baldaniorum TaxID=1064539 RepID=A0A9P1JUN5_9PROT|nr:hypothetical protein Sp245p_18390 [Azospirillum baldaniorum]CCD00154.1 exported protein of unknown function [Azospirillum baldaniorum]
MEAMRHPLILCVFAPLWLIFLAMPLLATDQPMSRPLHRCRAGRILFNFHATPDARPWLE